jgi:hypothetical protein
LPAAAALPAGSEEDEDENPEVRTAPVALPAAPEAPTAAPAGEGEVCDPPIEGAEADRVATDGTETGGFTGGTVTDGTVSDGTVTDGVGIGVETDGVVTDGVVSGGGGSMCLAKASPDNAAVSRMVSAPAVAPAVAQRQACPE